jgi:hypothetical protein
MDYKLFGLILRIKPKAQPGVAQRRLEKMP